MEHPKSFVNNFIAKHNKLQITILEVKFSHRCESDNKNIFECMIKFETPGKIYRIKSEEYLNKKDCEKDAYGQIKDLLLSLNLDLELDNKKSFDLSDEINKLKLTRNKNKTVYVLIDFENIPKLDDIALLNNFKIENKTIKVLKIAGFCSGVKANADIIVRSNRKDAVDHYISYMVGLLESACSPEIYVVTRDKFGSCLQDFCKNVKHCSDVHDFMNIAN